MTGRPSPADLADRLALAIVEHGPCAGERLARIVRTRRADVVAALIADPRFERVGRGRDTRWTLLLARWDGLGREDTPAPRESVGRAEFDRLARRVSSLERRLAEPEPARTRSAKVLKASTLGRPASDSRSRSTSARPPSSRRGRRATTRDDNGAVAGQLTVDDAIIATNGEAPA